MLWVQKSASYYYIVCYHDNTVVFFVFCSIEAAQIAPLLIRTAEERISSKLPKILAVILNDKLDELKERQSALQGVRIDLRLLFYYIVFNHLALLCSNFRRLALILIAIRVRIWHLTKKKMVCFACVSVCVSLSLIVRVCVCVCVCGVDDEVMEDVQASNTTAQTSTATPVNEWNCDRVATWLDALALPDSESVVEKFRFVRYVGCLSFACLCFMLLAL
jgi:hypothetical protein